MPSASRAMLLCGVLGALSAPSPQGQVRSRRIRLQSFVAAHDPAGALQQQQPRHQQCPSNGAGRRRKCRRQRPQQGALLLAPAWARLPARKKRGEIRIVRTTSTASTHVLRPSVDRSRRRRDSGLPRFHSTWLTASPSPGDASFTSEVLSPAEILEFVRRVDFFGLPPGGVTAGEEGYQRALPMQVLECIRHRHGLPDFAGGPLLLDPEYEYEEKSPPSSAWREGRGLLFPGLRLLHAEPIVIGVDNFFTPEECDDYISRSVSPRQREYVSRAGMGPFKQPAALGSEEHTSTTFFHQFSEVPELMAKASTLMGVDFADGQWEEAQTMRYRPGEEFSWHLDAMTPTPDMELQGGQRIANLLVYLNDLPDEDGGATVFKNLGLRVRPRKGSALVFFPSFGGVPDCPLDPLLLHAGEKLRPGAGQEKWIAQLRLRKGRTTPLHKDNQHAYAEAAVEDFDKKFWRSAFVL